jgi:hypothetical protein
VYVELLEESALLVGRHATRRKKCVNAREKVLALPCDDKPKTRSDGEEGISRSYQP